MSAFDFDFLKRVALNLKLADGEPAVRSFEWCQYTSIYDLVYGNQGSFTPDIKRITLQKKGLNLARTAFHEMGHALLHDDWNRVFNSGGNAWDVRDRCERQADYVSRLVCENFGLPTSEDTWSFYPQPREQVARTEAEAAACTIIAEVERLQSEGVEAA